MHIPEALNRLSAMESHFAKNRSAAMDAVRRRESIQPHVITEVEELILPQCHRAVEALLALSPPPHTTPRVQALIQYVQLHEQAWQAFTTAVTTG